MDTHPTTSPATATPAFSRRTALALGTAALAGAVFRPHVARAAMPFTQPPLPYKDDELVPTISARTVGLHYGKHHKGYYDKLNALAQGKPYADMSLSEVVVAARKANDAEVFNNAAQAWNHDLYWASFKGGPTAPSGPFKQAVEKDFQSLVGLQRKMVETGDKVFGTGWVWLVRDGDTLDVIGLKDAANPLPDGKKVLLGIDVWEHAYYLDYENRRTAHVEAVLKDLVNWQVVSERFG